MLGELTLYFVAAPVLAVFGFMLRRTSVKIDEMMTEPEIRMLINDRLDPIHVQQTHVEHELARLDQKLDRILDLLLNDKR